MPTAAETLLTQIAAIDARISSAAGATSMADGATSASFSGINELIDARNKLQAMYDRMTGASPMIKRGRVVGLPGGCVSQGRYV